MIRSKLTINFYIDQEDYVFIKKIAQKTKRSMASFYREGISYIVHKYSEQESNYANHKSSKGST